MAETNNELMLITVEGSEYSLSKTPPNGSAMVEKMKADITQGLQVGDIVRNLKNISGMLFVAYNALGGTMMQSKVSGLQKDYLQLLDDSGTAITGFKNKSEEICIFVAKAYDWLTRGKESMAITQFDKCAKAAAVMAKTAEGLAARYITMSNQTEHVLEGTQDEQATQYKKMDEMKRQQDEFNAELASQEAMKAQLAQDIESINNVYEDARDREKEAYSTKKGLMITQAVIGCIGAILPFGKSVGGGGGQGSGQASAQAQKELDEKKQEETGLKQTLTAEQAALDELKKNREPVAAAVKELEQELAVEKGVTGKSEEEHAQAIADLETKLQQKQAELAENGRRGTNRGESRSGFGVLFDIPHKRLMFGIGNSPAGNHQHIKRFLPKVVKQSVRLNQNTMFASDQKVFSQRDDDHRHTAAP